MLEQLLAELEDPGLVPALSKCLILSSIISLQE